MPANTHTTDISTTSGAPSTMRPSPEVVALIGTAATNMRTPGNKASAQYVCMLMQQHRKAGCPHYGTPPFLISLSRHSAG